ncbi:winged helix-turn-helix transcriptional regulator [Hymenobacter bucti]|uniref:Winged helix-turn-helix transcriptional regulator n=1 Tax=Hymenobacter bucti TaxID=1844114 RepID=A0ABW4QQZ7_9BACT
MDTPTLGYCIEAIRPLRDALDIVNGKWKLQILVALRVGHHRFRELERVIPGISSKVLAKELKDLEQHQLIQRTVHEGPPVLVKYDILPYAITLDPVISALRDWGEGHRKKIMGSAVEA